MNIFANKWLKMVSKDWMSLEAIPESEQTEKVCREALKQNGTAIVYIKNQTEELCKAALDNTYKALRYIKKPTDAIYEYAIDKDWRAIELIDNPSPELCMRAVMSDNIKLTGEDTEYDDYEYINAIQLIDEQTPELCEAAINKNEYAFLCIDNITSELCKLTLEKNGMMLKYIPDEFLSQEIYLTAIRQNPMSLKYIENQNVELIVKAAGILNVELEDIDNEKAAATIWNNFWNDIVDSELYSEATTLYEKMQDDMDLDIAI